MTLSMPAKRVKPLELSVDPFSKARIGIRPLRGLTNEKYLQNLSRAVVDQEGEMRFDE